MFTYAQIQCTSESSPIIYWIVENGFLVTTTTVVTELDRQFW